MAARAQYVHLRGRATLPAPLLKHLEGREDARPDEAMDRPGLDRSIDLGAEPERARLVVANALAARAAAGTGGRPPMQCIDVLIAGPPAFESPEAWPTDRLEDWGADSVKWLRSLLPPKTPLYSAHLHTDETSPHVHPAFPPALADAKGVVALSWKRMQAYMAESAAGRPIKGGPAQLRALQDSYFREVGQKYGLERGKVGAKIEYAPLDRTEGLKRRVSGAEARAAEEQQRRTEAEKRATDSDAASRQAAAAAERERELRLETERRTADERAAAKRTADTATTARANKAATADERERTARLADAERRDGAAAEAETRVTAAETRATAAETRAAEAETLAAKAMKASRDWLERLEKREAEIVRGELRRSRLERKYNKLVEGVKLLEEFDSGNAHPLASQLLLERDAATERADTAERAQQAAERRTEAAEKVAAERAQQAAAATDRADAAERAARAATERADTAERAQQAAERRTEAAEKVAAERAQQAAAATDRADAATERTATAPAHGPARRGAALKLRARGPAARRPPRPDGTPPPDRVRTDAPTATTPAAARVAAPPRGR